MCVPGYFDSGPNVADTLCGCVPVGDYRARYTVFAIRRQKKLPLRGTADRQQLFQPLEPQSKLVLRDEDEDETRSAIAAFEIADSGTGHAPTWQLPELEAICALHALDSSKFGDVLDQMLDAPAERSGVRAVQYVLVRDVPAVAQAATRVVPRCMIGRDMLSELRAPIEICKRVVDEKTTERGERGILRMTQPAELDAATEAATVKALAARDDLDAEAAAESAAPAAPPPRRDELEETFEEDTDSDGDSVLEFEPFIGSAIANARRRQPSTAPVADVASSASSSTSNEVMQDASRSDLHCFANFMVEDGSEERPKPLTVPTSLVYSAEGL